jgi:transcriptional regulator with XRE-family HTH domain
MPHDEHQLYRSIGARLREQRLAVGLSQAQLAERIGMLRTSITNIESGRQRVPIHVLYDICEALSVSVHAVLPVQEEAAEMTTVPVTVGTTTTEVSPMTAAFVRGVLNEERGTND